MLDFYSLFNSLFSSYSFCHPAPLLVIFLIAEMLKRFSYVVKKQHDFRTLQVQKNKNNVANPIRFY